MILDSSAIVAVLCREKGFEALVEKIGTASSVAVGAPTVFEPALVLTAKLRRDGLALVHEFLREAGAVITPFGEEHVSAAYVAHLRYGKGRHEAALNFGDCLSYAAAKLSGDKLLFVGNDFPKTDIGAA